jgi:hypothetical protein
MWKCSHCGENVEDSFQVCWSCGTTRDGVLDPHFFDAEGAGAAPENEPMDDHFVDTEEEPEPMVTVAHCNLLAEAHAMRVQLEAEGIPVFLADELTVAMDWLLSNAIGGVKVQVPERYAARATQLLEKSSQSAQEERPDESGHKSE